MLGKLTKLLVPELRFNAAEPITIESGANYFGQLKQEVQVVIEPQSLHELAIIMRLTFDGRRTEHASESELPMFTSGCLVVGVYPFERTITASDAEALTDEVAVRANLQVFPIARGKLLGLLSEVGFNSPDFPLENPLIFPLVAIPSRQPSPTKPAAKRKRKAP